MQSPSRSCLLFVVQATASMRKPLGVAPDGSGKRPSKLLAARQIVRRTFAALRSQAAAAPLALDALDVGMLVYGEDVQGETVLRAPLPGASPVEPIVPLAALATNEGSSSRLEPFTGQGEARPAEALAVADRVIRAWLAEHPGAARPLVVHITDGAGCDDALARAARSLRALTAAGQNVALCHCVLSEARVPALPRPTAAAHLPTVRCRALWCLSTRSRGGRRELSLNDLSAAGLAALVRPSAARDAGKGLAVPATPWRLECRRLWVQKGGNASAECEDASVVEPARGLVAVSDGAGEGIFSRLWATILTQRLSEEEPSPGDPAALARWLDSCRGRWLEEINFPALRLPQQHRVRTTGAGATLLALRLGGTSRGSVAPPDRCPWSAWAVGDSCLFWVRDNRLRASFPAVDADEFGLTPPLLRTQPDNPVVTPLTAGGMGKLGDLFLLATDATAQLLLRQCEQGKSVWGEIWDWDESAWHNKVADWRQNGEMVNDDCTLVAARLVMAGAGAVVPPSSGPAGPP
jgi:hypothetical protein